MTKYIAKNAGEVFKYLLKEYNISLDDVVLSTRISRVNLVNFIRDPTFYLNKDFDETLCKYFDIPTGTFCKVQDYYKMQNKYTNNFITES